MKRTVSVLLACLLVVMAAAGLAHSGRTDSSGGHKDNKNKSGLGSYHYHCGGHPPHLHSGGVCPYGGGGSAPKATATPKPTAAPTQWPVLSAPAAASVATAAGDVRYGLTNIKGVNVRAKAATDAKKLDAFPLAGTAVIIVDEVVGDDDAIWYQIDLGGEAAFVLGRYIDEVTWKDYADAAGL